MLNCVNWRMVNGSNMSQHDFPLILSECIVRLCGHCKDWQSLAILQLENIAT